MLTSLGGAALANPNILSQQNFIIEIEEPLSFRYISWEITGVRDLFQFDPGLVVQVSEFEIYFNGNKVDISNATATNQGGNNPGSEEPDKINDNQVSTKWLDFNFRNSNMSTLVFDLGTPMSFDSYAWFTANDVPARDPTSWRLLVSENGIDWQVVSTVAGHTPTLDRFTRSPIYTVSFD